ncbi:TPA: hypothetical protein I9082_002263 [Clostridium perfringens]|nr:hypothetical protein [Clostridium perfringens]
MCNKYTTYSIKKIAYLLSKGINHNGIEITEVHKEFNGIRKNDLDVKLIYNDSDVLVDTLRDFNINKKIGQEYINKAYEIINGAKLMYLEISPMCSIILE